jgi:hypothetical protein
MVTWNAATSMKPANNAATGRVNNPRIKQIPPKSSRYPM